MNSAISLENVTKKLNGRDILKCISFTVEQGDIFGYLGPNGAGKTTTIRILLGLFEATSGKLNIIGQDINLSETRKKIGFALSPDGLYENMTAEENLDFYARIYGVTEMTKRISSLLKAVGLEDRAKDKTGTYSKGMRQRLTLARAMVHNPEVLILDEPTSGVDPTGQMEIRQIMLDLAHKEKKTVLLSSHNLDEVQKICNRIALIDRGEIKLYGELESLRRQMGGSLIVIETAENIADTLLDEIKSRPKLGFREQKNKLLYFAPEENTGVSEIISFLTERKVKIEGANRTEASLEEMYAAILKEAEPV